MSDNNQQNLALFIKESKIIADSGVVSFNRQLQAALNDGWMLHGNVFAVGNEYVVNLIRLDQRLVDFTQKILDVGMSQLSELM